MKKLKNFQFYKITSEGVTQKDNKGLDIVCYIKDCYKMSEESVLSFGIIWNKDLSE
jgi:hypothetical protein